MSAPRTSLATAAVKAITHPTGSRVLENIGFCFGVAIGVAYVTKVEILSACTSVHPAFPTGLVIICGLLVAPKMLGKGTSGRIWEAISKRFGGP